MDTQPTASRPPAAAAPAAQPSLVRPLATAAAKYFVFKAAELGTAPLRVAVGFIPGVGKAIDLVGYIPVVGSLTTLFSGNVKQKLWRDFTMATAGYGTQKLLDSVEKVGGQTSKALFVDALGLAGITDIGTLTTAVHGRIYSVFGEGDGTAAPLPPQVVDTLNPLSIVMEAFQFVCTYAVANEGLFRAVFDGFVERGLEGSKSWQVVWGVLPGESWAKWSIQGVLRILVRYLIIETFAANNASAAYTDAKAMGGHAERLAGIQTADNELLEGTRVGDFFNKTMPGFVANVILPERSRLNLNEKIGPNIGDITGGIIQYSAHLMQTHLTYDAAMSVVSGDVFSMGIKSLITGGAATMGMNTLALGGGIGMGVLASAAMYGACPVGDCVQSGLQTSLASMVILGNLQSTLGVAPQTASALRTMALVSLAMQSPDVLKGVMGWMEWKDQRELAGLCDEALKLSVGIQDPASDLYIAQDIWPEFIRDVDVGVDLDARSWGSSLGSKAAALPPSTQLRELYRLPLLKMDFKSFHEDLDTYTSLYKDAAILEGEMKALTRRLVQAKNELADLPQKIVACMVVIDNQEGVFKKEDVDEAAAALPILNEGLRKAQESEDTISSQIDSVSKEFEKKKRQIEDLRAKAGGEDRPYDTQFRWKAHEQSVISNKLALLENRYDNANPDSITNFYGRLTNYIEDIEQKTAAFKYRAVHTDPVLQALRDTQAHLHNVIETLETSRKQLSEEKARVDAECKDLKDKRAKELDVAINNRIQEIETIDETTSVDGFREKQKMLYALIDDGLITKEDAESVEVNMNSSINALQSEELKKELQAAYNVVNLDNIMPLDGKRGIHKETVESNITTLESATTRVSVEDVLGIAPGQVLNAVQTGLSEAFKKTPTFDELEEVELYISANKAFLESVEFGKISVTVEGHDVAATDSVGATLALRDLCGADDLYLGLTNIISADSAKHLIESTTKGFIEHNGEFYVAYRPERLVTLPPSTKQGDIVSFEGKQYYVQSKIATLASGETQWAVRSQQPKRYLKINTSVQPQITFNVYNVTPPKEKNPESYIQSIRVHMEATWSVEGHVRELGGTLRETTKPSSMSAEVVYHANKYVVEVAPNKVEASAEPAKQGWGGYMIGAISRVIPAPVKAVASALASGVSTFQAPPPVVLQGLSMDYTAAKLVISDELKVKN